MHIDEVWLTCLEKALAAPLQQGSQGGLRQLAGHKICLDGSVEQFLTNERRKLSPVYASAELLWYLSRQKSIAMIQHYAPQYDRFADDGEAYGAYGARFAHNAGRDLIYEAINVLKQKSSTKRCTIGIWRPDDLLVIREYKDVPCTISWQFLEHDGALDMMVCMRSNDLWKGFLYDVYVNTCFHRYVAASVGVRPGIYHHVAGSLHLYEADHKKARQAIEAPYRGTKYRYIPSPEASMFNSEQLALALEIEESSRLGIASVDPKDLPQVLGDAVRCCVAPHHGEIAFVPTSDNLRVALERMYDKRSEAGRTS